MVHRRSVPVLLLVLLGTALGACASGATPGATQPLELQQGAHTAVPPAPLPAQPTTAAPTQALVSSTATATQPPAIQQAAPTAMPLTPVPAQPTTAALTQAPVPSTSAARAPGPAGQATVVPSAGQPTTPFFAHYYIWWDSTHWLAKLGPEYPYSQQPLPLPATLASDGCQATSSYSSDQLIDIPAPPLNLYSQDDPATFSAHIHEAATAGVSGFVVSWSGTGTVTQTARSSSFNSRLASLVNQVDSYNQQHQQRFYLLLGYQGLDNSRKPRSVSWVVNDLNYFLQTYKTSPVFHTPWYGNKPVIMFLDSRQFAPALLQTIITPIRALATFIGDEHGTAEWNRGVADYFDGDGWYFSSQNPVTNAGAFPRLASLAAELRSEHKLWFAPLSGGYNKQNFGLGGGCVPRNNGQTMQLIYQGNQKSKPDGFMYISWNEFLENTYLEPSLRYGDQYLKELQSFIASNR